jgi:outer membrane protein OmpA-like peptidoglycan-associated protein
VPSSALETVEAPKQGAGIGRSAGGAVPDLRQGLTPASFARLHGTVGNRAVQRLVTSGLPGATASRNRVLARQCDVAEDVRISRAEEIRRSRTSPGCATAQEDPPAISLYNFGHDRDELKDYHHDLLVELARFIRYELMPGVRVRVIGHASAPGSAAYNVDLAERRANRVAALLTAEGLADVVAESRGESDPVASNDTVGGRSRNRRVDVRLLPPRRPTPPPPGPEPPGPEPPGPEPPGPEPPGPEPPRPPRPRERDWCERYPLLCGLIPLIPIIPLFPPPWALICVIAPPLCASVPCLLDPLACIPDRPDPPPEPPDRDRPPRRRTPRVLFGRVRARNTPSAMGDRIPDSGSTLVPVTVLDYDPSEMGPISIVPVGAGSATGEFLIDGGQTASITGSTLLDIAGQRQTAQAAGFRLRLEAMLGGASVGRSEPFAVAAIMENMRTRRHGEVVDATGAMLLAEMSWDSDGADGIGSLDLMEYGEQLELLHEEGGMAGMGLFDWGFLVLADRWQIDRHGMPVEFLQVPGRQQIHQVHTLVDYRTGSTGEDIPVTNSGFLIERVVEPDPDRAGCLRYVITKSGRAGTVTPPRHPSGGRPSFTSGAGSGTAQLTVRLPCRGGGGGGRPRPDRDGGGGGSTPTTPTVPTPHTGPIPPGRVPFGYVSGVPSWAFPGMVVVMTIVFAATSTDPARPGRKLFTAEIPCFVDDTTPTYIYLKTANPMPLSLAPPGFAVTVMPPLTRVRVPRSLL